MKLGKKLLALGLGAMMVIGAAGCGSDASQQDTGEAADTGSAAAVETAVSEESAAGETADGPMTKYAETIDLHFARSTDETVDKVLEARPEETLEDNFWLDTYRDELGINVIYDWIVKGGDEYTQKVNVTIANGELPDVMYVNKTQVQQMQEAGLLMDMTDIFDQYATDFTKEVMNQEGNSPFLPAMADGRLYGIPITNGSIDGVDVMWIRKDWLDKLGLEAPSTVDELMEVIEQFTTGDPDGNGENDTYGIGVAGSPNLFNGNFGSMKGFFDAYGAHPTIWYEKDGQLVYGGIQEECKEALSAINEMYENGWINPEFGVMDPSKAGEAAAAGKCGITFGPQWLSQTEMLTNYKSDHNALWCAYPLPSLTADEPSLAATTSGTSEFLVVSKECEHPEAVVKMANLFIEKCWGETGDNAYYYAPADAEGIWKLSPLMPQMPLKNLQGYRDIVEAQENGTADQLTGESKSIYDKIQQFEAGGEGSEELYGWERGYGSDLSAYSAIDVMEKDGRVLIDEFAGAPGETMTEKMSTLEKMRDEIFVKIVLGESDVSEFDKYVEDFNNLGGAEIQEEVNAWKASVGA